MFLSNAFPLSSIFCLSTRHWSLEQGGREWKRKCKPLNTCTQLIKGLLVQINMVGALVRSQILMEPEERMLHCLLELYQQQWASCTALPRMGAVEGYHRLLVG